MQGRHWYGILLAVLLWTGYRLFYKHRPANTVPASADAVAVLDVKRLTNSLIWEFIRTPSLWKSASLTPGKGKFEALTDLVEWPDYILAFHLPGEPVSAWYSSLPISDSGRFAAELLKAGFKQHQQIYYSGEAGLQIRITGKRILTGINSTDGRLQQIAAVLAREQELLPAETLEKILKFRDHAAIYYRPVQSTSQSLTLRLNREGLLFRAGLQPPEQVQLRRYPYHYYDSSLCTLAFTQPAPSWKALLPDSIRNRIAQLLGYEPDSLLAPGNLYYELDLQGFSNRTDTLVAYSYNEQFEPVETRRTQEVREPVFNFGIQAPDAAIPFRQMLDQRLLTPDTAGFVCTAVPFVKSYARVQHAQKMVIHSWQYPARHFQHTRTAVAYARLNPGKIPEPLLAYLPTTLQQWLPRISLAELLLDYNDKGELQLELHIQKRKREGSSLDW